MQPTKPYRHTQYKFGTMCLINHRNPAFKRGYLYRATLYKTCYYDFVKSCESLFGRFSGKYSIEWHQYEDDPTKFNRWMISSRDYEVFFKEYEDFEEAKLHYALTNG